MDKNIILSYITKLQNDLCLPVVEGIDKFLDAGKYNEEERKEIKKNLMLSVGASLMIQSHASKEDIQTAIKSMYKDLYKIRKYENEIKNK